MATGYRTERRNYRQSALQELEASNQSVPLRNADSKEVSAEEVPSRNCVGHESAALIINADDWGSDVYTTGRILDCMLRGSISSASAMVFMEDSERAAAIALERGIDTGLHLNLTTAFTAASCPRRLKEHQQKLANYLCGFSFARAIYHPRLVRSFEYAVKAQIEEYSRIYGAAPQRFDGHHHVHLSANILLGNLLPRGATVRRHFSWEPGEKTLRNLLFRWFTDRLLARDHPLVDFFFSLPPIEPWNRMRHICFLACRSIVELETHPVNPDEYRFLADGTIFRLTEHPPVASRFAVAARPRL